MMEWKQIGFVGVDSGTLMISDPCYTVGTETLEWDEFCENHLFKDGADLGSEWDDGTGVTAATRWGDGKYPVFALFDDRSKRPTPLAMMVVTEDMDGIRIPGLVNSI